jgi:nitroreductase/Pyruvate/2-oxoacid:ferredoxin oxidoreductase delta subunit
MSAILIDKHLCTRCNTCAKICVMGIIKPATEISLPRMAKLSRQYCMKCGHCEAFCPTRALVLDFYKEEKIAYQTEESDISAENLSLYLKQRRSVRHFLSKPVDKEIIKRVLDTASYAPTGGNTQTVSWMVIHDTKKVKQIAALTVDWMRTLLNTTHPMAAYVPGIIAEWEKGSDPVCRKAPHVLYTHIPVNEFIDDRTDGIIALSYLDIAAPAFGLGTCWAGFIMMAAMTYQPLQQILQIPEGRKMCYAMLFGYPQYKVTAIPRRNPVNIGWL